MLSQPEPPSKVRIHLREALSFTVAEKCMICCSLMLVKIKALKIVKNLATLLFTVLALEGCAHILGPKNPDEVHDYVEDATNCNDSSQQFQSMNVPSGMSQTIIQIPLGLDKNKYIDCMKQKGWSVLPSKTFEIENLDSHCKQLNQETPESPKSHSECLEHNKLEIEVIPNK